MTESIETDWDLLLSRSADVMFVDDTTHFQCVGCREIFTQHYVLLCGHNFCFNCKINLTGGKRRWKCPLPACARRIREMYLQKLNFEESVYELSAHCPNHKYGCSYVGTLRDLGGHLRLCEQSFPVVYMRKTLEGALNAVQEFKNELNKFNQKFATMNLAVEEMRKSINEMKNKEKDDKLIQRRKWAEFDKRINSLAAEFEGKSITKINGKSEYAPENRPAKSKMNGKCESWVEMMEEEDGKGELKTEVNNNVATEMTTEKQVSQEIVNNNIKLDKPNTVLMPNVYRMNNNNNNQVIKSEVDHLRRVNDYYKEAPDFTWIVSGVASFLNKTIVQISSGVFPLRGYPFGAQVKLAYDFDGDICFNLAFKLTEKTNWHSKIQPIPTLSWTVKDRSSHAERRDFVTGGWFVFADPPRFNVFCNFFLDPPNNYASILRNPLYRVNDTVVVDIHVEPPEVSQLTYSHDGTLLWTIDDFQKRKQLEADGLRECYTNPYFYTSLKRYKILSQTYLNGKEKHRNQGLTVDIGFVNGLFDDSLSKFFPHKTTAVVYNPNDPQKNITKIVEKDVKDNAVYAIDMGTHQEIENLLDNDTLTYKITVETL